MFRVLVPPVVASRQTALAQRGFHGSAILRLTAASNKTIKLLPTQLVIAAFNRFDGADDAANKLIDALNNNGGTELGISCHNICIIRKQEKGKAKITEMGKIKKRHGAAAGALAAGASVLLLGPIAVTAGALGGALAGAVAGGGTVAAAAYGASAAAQGTLLAHIAATAGGAATGAYAASKIETLDPVKLKGLGNILQPSQSAIIAVFDQVAVPMDKLQPADFPGGGKSQQATRDQVLSRIANDIGHTLKEEGKDVAYWLAADEDAESLIATRLAVGDDAIDIMGLVVAAEDPSTVVGDVPFDGPDTEVIEYEVVDGKVVEPSPEDKKE